MKCQYNKNIRTLHILYRREISKRGLNLLSSVKLSGEDVKYIARKIREMVT